MTRAEPFVLIPGRTSRQGCAISEGKFSANYLDETGVLQLAPADMQRLDLTNGDVVKLSSADGQVELPVRAAGGDSLPEGVAFIAYGDRSSRLMGADTHGSGMPTSKGLDVLLEVVKRFAAGQSNSPPRGSQGAPME